ncbi:MAG: choice-of-anchor B family protein [Gammaproteobacteria bacterium]|nr:choice-of-anchor B family protein [Gammaproteobacteria bacterium]
MKNFSLYSLLLLTGMSLPATAGTACVNGDAEGISCNHIDSVAVLDVVDMTGEASLNDIWGWVAADDTEYALVAGFNGTNFVRLNADDTLTYLGRLPASDGRAAGGKPASKSCDEGACGEGSSWRDVKVYQDYAYIVSEAGGHGLQIFDLTQLQAATPGQAWTEADYTLYGDFGSAHNIFINEDTARAYVVGNDDGTTGSNGGLHILDISTPTAPVLLADVPDDGYTHDVQCVVYAGPDTPFVGREICFAANEDTLTIWDVTDPGAISMLARQGYSAAAYTHQVWLSEDHKHLYLNDELDETRLGNRTELRIFDVTLLSEPALASSYFAPTLSIDHNNYVHGRWLYQSNYEAGFRILDISTPEQPVEAAYFDWMVADGPRFNGNWSNYLFPSGRVALSGMNDGLYVARPTLAAENGSDLSVAFENVIADTNGMESAPLTVNVQNLGSAAATDVVVTAHLPRTFAFGTVDSITPGSCTKLLDERVLECRIGDLAAGASWSVDVPVQASVRLQPIVYGMVYGNEADADSSNNKSEQELTFTLPLDDVGGGGGGSLGVLTLLGLVLVGLRKRWS